MQCISIQKLSKIPLKEIYFYQIDIYAANLVAQNDKFLFSTSFSL